MSKTKLDLLLDAHGLTKETLPQSKYQQLKHVDTDKLLEQGKTQQEIRAIQRKMYETIDLLDHFMGAHISKEQFYTHPEYYTTASPIKHDRDSIHLDQQITMTQSEPFGNALELCLVDIDEEDKTFLLEQLVKTLDDRLHREGDTLCGVVLNPIPKMPASFTNTGSHVIHEALKLHKNNQLSFGHCLYLLSKVAILMYHLEEHEAFCTSINQLQHAAPPELKAYLLDFRKASYERSLEQLPEYITTKREGLLSPKRSDFQTACDLMTRLLVLLHKNGSITRERYFDLLSKTASLIYHPEKYETFKAEAKHYQKVAGGALAAYILLIAGYAAKIVTCGVKGDAWIKLATDKLHRIKNNSLLASVSEQLAEMSEQKASRRRGPG